METNSLVFSIYYIICLIQITLISNSSLIAEARTSSTMLNKSGDSGYPCILPDLRGRFSAFHHWTWYWVWTSQFMSDSLWSRGLCHSRLSCPSPSPGAYSNSYLLNQWCHLTMLSSVVPFSSCLQSFPASGSFQWVGSSHQVAKVSELQLQHQSFQWIFGAAFLRIDCFNILAV